MRSPNYVRALCVGLALAIGVVALGQGEFVHPAEAEPARQFDFWLGEWDVTNRFLREDGSWQEVAASAKIWAALDGQVIVEHWASRSEQWPMRGFSMRAYDPATETWTIALCWPNPAGETANFSFMEGAFRDGRGEFFPKREEGDDAPGSVRFTFSDASANSLRWDQALRTDDGGWRTTWIMEWERRGADAPLDMGWVHGGTTLTTPNRVVVGRLEGHWTMDAQGPADLNPNGFVRARPMGMSQVRGTAVLNRAGVLLATTENEPEFAEPGVRKVTGSHPVDRRLGLLVASDGDKGLVYCDTIFGQPGFTVWRGQLEDEKVELVAESGDARQVIEFVEGPRVFWTDEQADSGLWMPVRRLTLSGRAQLP